MIGLALGVKVYRCTQLTDMRRGFDGLSGMAESLMEQDPLSGHLFVLRNRDKLKILYWDQDGLAIWYKWLEQETFLPKSLIGKAATYTRNQWQALNRYVEDGDLAIDNNFAERAMRPIAIGRKNWLFVGSEAAGHRAAVLTSLIASWKNNFVEPWAYLKDVLTKLPHKPQQHELIELLPNRWLKLNPNKRWEIAEIRKAERQKKM